MTRCVAFPTHFPPLPIKKQTLLAAAVRRRADALSRPEEPASAAAPAAGAQPAAAWALPPRGGGGGGGGCPGAAAVTRQERAAFVSAVRAFADALDAQALLLCPPWVRGDPSAPSTLREANGGAHPGAAGARRAELRGWVGAEGVRAVASADWPPDGPVRAPDSLPHHIIPPRQQTP